MNTNKVNWTLYELAQRRLPDALRDQRPRNVGLRQIKRMLEQAEKAVRNAEE